MISGGMAKLKKLWVFLFIMVLILPFTGCRRDQDYDLDYSLVDRGEEDSDQGGQDADPDHEETEEESDNSDELDLDDLFEPVYVTVTGSSVNLRQGPGTKFDKVGSAQAGDRLEVVYFMEHWINIKMQDGQEGFIAGWLTDAKLPQPDSVNLEEEKLEIVP